MRHSVFLLAVLGLAACMPVIPDSAAGVGFSNDNGASTLPLSAMPLTAMPVQPQPQPMTGSGFSTAAAAAAIDKAEGKTPDAPLPQASVSYGQPLGTGLIIGGANRPRGNAPAGIVETTSEMQSVAKISDEQDFDAVSQRETIESDKVRIDRNRAQYQIDQPTALPQRLGEAGPNIVQFALSSRNPRGTQVYRRSSLRLTSYNAACARYASPDLAQEAFLNAGGPVRDRKGLDPDGDGYACAWDPAPFREAVQN